MGKSQETWNKKEKEKKRQQKKKEKAAKKEERKANSASGGDWQDMIAYVDENGNIVDEAPDPTIKKKKIKAEDIEIGVPKKEDQEPEINEGTVAFFNDEKGYGFINRIGDGEKLFYHINNTLEEVIEGNKVTFDIEKGPKGYVAVNVKKA